MDVLLVYCVLSYGVGMLLIVITEELLLDFVPVDGEHEYGEQDYEDGQGNVEPDVETKEPSNLTDEFVFDPKGPLAFVGEEGC